MLEKLLIIYAFSWTIRLGKAGTLLQRKIFFRSAMKLELTNTWDTSFAYQFASESNDLSLQTLPCLLCPWLVTAIPNFRREVSCLAGNAGRSSSLHYTWLKIPLIVFLYLSEAPRGYKFSDRKGRHLVQGHCLDSCCRGGWDRHLQWANHPIDWCDVDLCLALTKAYFCF